MVTVRLTHYRPKETTYTGPRRGAVHLNSYHDFETRAEAERFALHMVETNQAKGAMIESSAA